MGNYKRYIKTAFGNKKTIDYSVLYKTVLNDLPYEIGSYIKAKTIIKEMIIFGLIQTIYIEPGKILLSIK